MRKSLCKSFLYSSEKHFRHERHVGLHGDDGPDGADVRLCVGGDGVLVGPALSVVEVSVLLTAVAVLDTRMLIELSCS